VLVTLDRLPWVLSELAARLAPEFRLEVGQATLDSLHRLELHHVTLRTEPDGATVLRAKRAVVRFSPWTIARGHLDLILLDEPRLTPRPSLPALGRSNAESHGRWSIDRVVARRGRFLMPPEGDLSGVTFRFALDLRDVGNDDVLAELPHRVTVKDVKLAVPGAAPLVAMRGGTVQLSIAGLTERRRVDEVLLRSPIVTVGRSLPSLPSSGEEHGNARPLTIGRLVIRDGRFWMPASDGRPGVAFRFTTDLENVGTGPDEAAAPRSVALRGVAVALPDGTQIVTMDALIAKFTIAGLEAKRLDEVALVTPVLSLPSTVAAARPAEPQPSVPPAAGWTIGRLVTHDGRLGMTASETLPNLSAGFAFDLREIGADRDRAARPQRIRVRDLRVRFPHRPTSLVLDSASVDFTMAGLLEHRRLAGLRVDRGLLVLDRALRDQLSASQGGTPSAATRWSLGVLDIAQLGIRLSDLGPQIPDVTLLIHSRLTDVPLAPGALAKARTPQRLELSNLTLDSPLDPFRPVVHVGSIFVEFTLADLIAHQLGSIAVVSPTIYLGEDLIWYMNTTRVAAAAAPSGQPWTVRSLRADLGKIVITFRGVNRASLPLNFRTDARNVILGDLATLQLAVALQVPKQNYTFPGLDLALIDVEGELRFDYPPGQARDNVVNTLRVDRIRWRDYVVRDGWLAATFDQKGVNGKLGGNAYDGYMNGGVSVPFGPGAMSGWAAGTDLDLAPLAATVGGQSVAMTGLVDVEGAVEVLGSRIDRARATLDFQRPGLLSFPALDRLLDRLPAGTVSWQRDLARIAVEAFRDFPYATGSGGLTFADRRGEAHLGLAGERGKRQFDVYYHEDVPHGLETEARAE
jgi:hypothetical protein